MPKIIGVFVSDENFDLIYSDIYDRAKKSVRKRIDRSERKEWRFKGNSSMVSGFYVALEETTSEYEKKLYLVVIRSKDYMVKEDFNPILRHELLHIIDR